MDKILDVVKELSWTQRLLLCFENIPQRLIGHQLVVLLGGGEPFTRWGLVEIRSLGVCP